MIGRLRTSAVRIKEAERRATLGELARQVNHDIKNGLTPIRNVFRHLAQIIRDHVVRHASKKRLHATPPAPYNNSSGRSYRSVKLPRVSFEALYRDRSNVPPQLMEGIRQYANPHIPF